MQKIVEGVARRKITRLGSQIEYFAANIGKIDSYSQYRQASLYLLPRYPPPVPYSMHGVLEPIGQQEGKRKKKPVVFTYKSW